MAARWRIWAHAETNCRRLGVRAQVRLQVELHARAHAMCMWGCRGGRRGAHGSRPSPRRGQLRLDRAPLAALSAGGAESA